MAGARSAVPGGGVRIIVIGSGPIGSTYARLLLERLPTATVLMAELGPQLTERAGMNVRNILDENDRARARHAAQGPQADADQLVDLGIPEGLMQEGTFTARQGTHLLDFGGPGSEHSDGLEIAAMSTAVGGMGSQWTCATPRPEFSERIPFIEPSVWDRVITEAESILHVTKTAFSGSPVPIAIRRLLEEEFAGDLPEGFGPSIMPVAGDEKADGTMTWTGVDTVLAQLLDPDSDEGSRFELRALTLAREILHSDGRATGVLLEDAKTGAQHVEDADLVIVAADTFRTPQLLWASGIRPQALGHYLTEHTGVMSIVALSNEAMSRFATEADLMEERRRRALNPADPVSGILRIPYSEPQSPQSAQIVYVDTTPYGIEPGAPLSDNHWGYANVGVGLRVFPRYENCVTFDDSQTDYRGFPTMSIYYRLGDREFAEQARAKEFVVRIASAIGEFAPGSEPREFPNGGSLHYMGTMRMGTSDDGTSVCDVESRLWGFDNLVVGGNGVIPTANAVNPTLTSVAIAVLGVEGIVRDLKSLAQPTSQSTSKQGITE